MAEDAQKRVMITLAGGGYENEARMLLRQLGPSYRYSYVTTRDNAWRPPERPFPGNFYVQPTPANLQSKSRLLMLLRMAYSTVLAMPFVVKESPDMIIGVASPVCLPLFFCGRLLGKQCVFIESITRTDSLSFTGRLAMRLRLARRVFVQWPSLVEKYPAAEYHGTVV